MKSDLISRRALIAFIDKTIVPGLLMQDNSAGAGVTAGFSKVLEEMDVIPTIDAAPVVHGKWVVDDLGHTHCSECGERLPFMHCYSEDPCSDYDEEWDEEISETRYCPHCGAKMDGGAAYRRRMIREGIQRRKQRRNSLL